MCRRGEDRVGVAAVRGGDRAVARACVGGGSSVQVWWYGRGVGMDGAGAGGAWHGASRGEWWDGQSRLLLRWEWLLLLFRARAWGNGAELCSSELGQCILEVQESIRHSKIVFSHTVRSSSP